ncbi:MAG: heparinase II/III family protein [Lentisphaeria bacterium]|nr:heparinase II/III family protein [Lentisphaeria bacterium]
MKKFMSQAEIAQRTRSMKGFRFFPEAGDRDVWEHFPEEKRKQLIREAEQAAAEPVPFLGAADYMKFPREGNRLAYETPYLRRRQLLAQLTLGECAENRGRFLDPIAEMLWQILSEPVWCWPAHQHLKEGQLLPGPEEWTIDLFAGQTAKLLSDTLLLVGTELEQHGFASLNARIRYEICRRVLKPAEGYTDDNCPWWYSGSNNWSVWCCYTLSFSALTVWQDQPERLAAFLGKHMIPVERFYDHYEPDGSCDEGPCYWAVSVGMLCNYLNLIRRSLGGLDEMFHDPKLHSMLEFLPGMNLCGQYFMNFADAEPKLLKFAAGLFCQYGLSFGNEELKALALTLQRPDPALYRFGNRDSNFYDEALAELAMPSDCRPARHYHAADYWPDRGIRILREHPENPEAGTVCALKGGHNGESHNHLDLGHLTLFRDGRPVIIDLGRGTYTRDVFSGKRFEVWFISSAGHNAARFNGIGQGVGKEFCCTAKIDGDRAEYNLTKAYLPESGLHSYRRQLEFDRGTGGLTIREQAEFSGRRRIDLRFFSPCGPRRDGDSISLGGMKITCSGIRIAEAGPWDYEDEKIRVIWGDLYHLDLQIEAENAAAWEIRFQPV